MTGGSWKADLHRIRRLRHDAGTGSPTSPAGVREDPLRRHLPLRREGPVPCTDGSRSSRGPPAPTPTPDTHANPDPATHPDADAHPHAHPHADARPHAHADASAGPTTPRASTSATGRGPSTGPRSPHRASASRSSRRPRTTTSWTDRYQTNRAQAKANGLLVGAYHFARPELTLTTGRTPTPSDAIAEADHFIDTATPQSGELIPVLDLEVRRGEPRRTADLRTWVRAFLERVYERTGVRAAIYVSPSFWSNQDGQRPDGSRPTATRPSGSPTGPRPPAPTAARRATGAG